MYTSTTTPEAKAREGINAQLQAAGWVIQGPGQRTSSGGVALCESTGDTGRADYILYLDTEAYLDAWDNVDSRQANAFAVARKAFDNLDLKPIIEELNTALIA